MKLSELTLTALKNFATINESIILRPGSVIRTMSTEEHIFAEVEVDDVFPVEFGIYDLNNFLGNIDVLNNPDLNFTEKVVHMDDGAIALSYYGAKSTSLITAPEAGKRINLKSPDATFDLTKDIFQKMMKIASMNKLAYLGVVGENGLIKIKTYDKKNPDSNNAYTPVGNFEGDDFTALFKVEHLKMLPDDYVVEMKNGVFAKFSSKNRKLQYVIGQEDMKED